MIRASELKQAEINIVFHEKEEERGDGAQGHGVKVRYTEGKPRRQVFEEGQNEADVGGGGQS